MAKNKRQAGAEDSVGLDNVHESRKKRVKYTEEDATLAGIYNSLADEDQSIRVDAASDLIQTLSDATPDQFEKLHTAEARLIKGLCSGRKAARLGFSIALTELFRLKFGSRFEGEKLRADLAETVDIIVKLTKSQGNANSQEKRDNFLGRRFSFQALLHSDAVFQKRVTDESWRHLLQGVFDLASQKPYLRRDCGAMLYDYLSSPYASKLSDSRARMVIEELIRANLAKTSEGVALWLWVRRLFPDVKLPKGIWHHNDPLSSKELPVLTKVLLETPDDDESVNVKNGSRQTTISFSWKAILLQLYERDEKRFFAFWESAVASTMFSSSASTERKALGLQILSIAISTAPTDFLERVISTPQIFSCILHHRSSNERYLFDATRIPLNHMVARARQEPLAAKAILQSLVLKGRPNFDQLTKSKIVEELIDAADEDALLVIVRNIASAIKIRPAKDQASAENERRALADLLTAVLRAHRQATDVFIQDSNRPKSYLLAKWANLLFVTLVEFAFERPDQTFEPALSNATQTTMRDRLMSALGLLFIHPVEKAVVAPVLVVETLSEIAEIQNEPSSNDRKVIQVANHIVENIKHRDHQDATHFSFQLLFSLSIIQVYNREADSTAALEDLVSCYRSLGDSEDSSTALIELLLSFISKPSTLFKKLAHHVFPTFAKQMTPESLQSLVDILEQKESLGGQQALFDQQAADNDMEADATSDDGIEVDVEEASDVELVNGHVKQDSEGEDDVSSSRSSVSAEEAVNTGQQDEDEVAIFDKKLAEALGTAEMDDSDDDGSDMDDDQMMALEPQLTSIFKERQKASSRKSERRDAKENVVNFKNRVLDLLVIYVKSQYSNILTLDLILPLTTLIRTTTSKPTAEKAFALLKQYFDLCSKNKTLPQPPDHEACFELVTALHAEVKFDGSKMHANACSRASLFLCKVLVGLNPDHYKRVAEMYTSLQAEWYLDPKSKVPSSMFTEWTSWSISTRKHTKDTETRPP